MPQGVGATKMSQGEIGIEGYSGIGGNDRCVMLSAQQTPSCQGYPCEGIMFIQPHRGLAGFEGASEIVLAIR